MWHLLIFCSLSWLNNILQHDHSIFCLFTHQLIKYLGSFHFLWLLWVMLLWIFPCKFIQKLMFLMFQDISQRVELLGHVATPGIIFWGRSKLIFTEVAINYIPISYSCMRIIAQQSSKKLHYLLSSFLICNFSLNTKRYIIRNKFPKNAFNARITFFSYFN